jgi:hypothetical protein
MSSIHPDIVEGNGTRESPFLVRFNRYLFSTIAQSETINRIYGEGTYQPHGPRCYYESPRGTRGNKDLCEHVLSVNGKEVSVWFDLSEVTRCETDPAFVKAREGLREMLAKDPATPRIQEEMRKAMGLPPRQQPKGCLVLLLVIIVIAAALLVFRWEMKAWAKTANQPPTQV